MTLVENPNLVPAMPGMPYNPPLPEPHPGTTTPAHPAPAPVTHHPGTSRMGKMGKGDKTCGGPRGGGSHKGGK